MSSVLASSGKNSWNDRTLLNLSSKTAEPFCQAWRYYRFRIIDPLDPGLLENYDSRIKKFAFRAILGVGAAFAAYLAIMAPIPILGSIFALGVLNRLLRYIGFSLQKEGFTYVKTSAEEKTLGSDLKIMTWNVCGIGGGLGRTHGGVVDWRLRIDAIANTIKKKNPDVLILQEIYDASLAKALISHWRFELKTERRSSQTPLSISEPWIQGERAYLYRPSQGKMGRRISERGRLGY
jgi:hypothetical protein